MNLNKKIMDLSIKSQELKKLQFEEVGYEQNLKIKKQQTETWNKMQFFKKLAKSIEKSKKED